MLNNFQIFQITKRSQGFPFSLIRFISIILILVGCLVSSESMAFKAFVVKNIRVQGLSRVSQAAVLNDLPIRVGQTLNESEASDAIRALYQTGFFKDVSLSRDGDTLIVHVAERAAISKLSINGIKDKDKVLKTLRESGIAEGRMYDPTLLGQAIKELEKHYFKKGKYGVKIESNVTEETPSMMHVTIDIYEGDIAKIKQIKIVGNKSFKESELMKDFHSSKTNLMSWMTNDDQYAKEKLYADLETLRSYYMDRGFIHFQVDSTQVSLTPNKKCIYITIHINEGDKYTFGKATVSGKYVVAEENVSCAVEPICAGETFSRKTILMVKKGLEDLMGNYGYAQAEARVNPVINEECKTVDIHYEMVPGKRMYVRRICFSGNVSTRDEVLRRELAQMEGTWISTMLLAEGKTSIMRRGFATEVEIETIPVPGTEDQVDVIYKVDEARTGQIGGGLGYSGTEKFMLNFNISQENFFGTGKLVEFSWDKSSSQNTVQVNYLDPYFTIDGIGMGASVYFSKVDLRKTTAVSDYTTDNFGGEFRFVFPLSKFDSFFTSFGYDNTHLKVPFRLIPGTRITTPAPEIQDFVMRYGKNLDEYLVGAGWAYDSLDERLFPKRGLHQALRLRAAVPGSNVPYYKITYDFQWFQPICNSDRWIINVASCLGYGDGFGRPRTKHGLPSNRQLPFYRHFYAGGTRYVRGFEENSLGPPDGFGRAFGGNVLTTATVALIFPNPIKPDAKSLRTSIFFDAGQVYDTHFRDKLLKNYQVLGGSNRRIGNHSGIRYSVGLSLTWHSPLGAPITISLARPLNAHKGDHKKAFNFWMGTQF